MMQIYHKHLGSCFLCNIIPLSTKTLHHHPNRWNFER